MQLFSSDAKIRLTQAGNPCILVADMDNPSGMKPGGGKLQRTDLRSRMKGVFLIQPF